MPKTAAADIKALGFTFGQFNLATAAEFDAWLDAAIAEQALLLEGRIGSTIYSTTATPASTYVKRAEKCLVAAELFQRRAIAIAGNAQPNGEEPVTASLDVQQKKYRTEAQELIDRLVAGSVSDDTGFASGVSVTSHFPEDVDA